MPVEIDNPVNNPVVGCEDKETWLNTYEILPIKSPFWRSEMSDSRRLCSTMMEEPKPSIELSSTEELKT
jgi:hypothetical protein